VWPFGCQPSERGSKPRKRANTGNGTQRKSNRTVGHRAVELKEGMCDCRFIFYRIFYANNYAV
jgi:hypothetical protein